jgi:hypothetical protein
MIADRTVHQIWISTDEIPKAFDSCRRSWEVMNPGWTSRLWTDGECEDLVATSYPHLLDRYERSRPLDQSNIFRILAVHRFGGAYVDLDMECLRPLDDLLHEHSVGSTDLVVGHEPDDHLLLPDHAGLDRLICSNFFMAGRGHPLLATMAQEIPNQEAGRLGPVFFERSVPRSGEGVVILDSEWINPIVDLGNRTYPSWKESKRKFRKRDYGSAYAVHYWVHIGIDTHREEIERARSCRSFVFDFYLSKLKRLRLLLGLR